MAKPENLKRLTSTPAPATGEVTEFSTAGLSTDTGRASRIGLWALAIGFGGFVLWAALAPLDEGVPAPGLVSIDTKRKTVQHLQGGLIKEVLVGEGTRVKEGQLLMRLDDAVARANYEASRQRYLNLRAVQGRLAAEQGGKSTISYHPDLVAASQDPSIRQQTMNQEQLLASRRAGLRADLQGMEENIQGQEGMIQSYESILISRRSQLALLNEELNNTRGLVKDGYAPRNRQFELERHVAESNAAAAELLGNVVRARRSIAEVRQRMISRQQEYRKEIESQIGDISREVTIEAEKLVAFQADLSRTEIKAPTSGQIVGLTVQTIGGVVSPGQKLMDVVPENEVLILETRVQSHFIDKVHAGLGVDVRFNAFANSPQLVVEGKVMTVSKDLLTDPQNGSVYYLARVSLTPDGMKKLGARALQPGMPAEVIFKTGERSVLTYLLHPLTKRMAASMKEE